MVGLYPDVDTYNNQLRDLEAGARVQRDPNSRARPISARLPLHGGSRDKRRRRRTNSRRSSNLSRRIISPRGSLAALSVPRLPSRLQAPRLLAEAGGTGAARPMDLAQAGGRRPPPAVPEGGVPRGGGRVSRRRHRRRTCKAQWSAKTEPEDVHRAAAPPGRQCVRRVFGRSPRTARARTIQGRRRLSGPDPDSLHRRRGLPWWVR